jgi:(1->4)-alpha-D-glucan 1-alpha-D-glucosylmutase
LLEHWTDGRLKLWTTHRALCKRTEARELFRHGDYAAIGVEGERKEHVVAFTRQHRQNTALVAVPRLNFTMLNGEPRLATAEDWGTTRLRPPQDFARRTFHNALTGQSITVQDNGELLCREIFAAFPVALLIE